MPLLDGKTGFKKFHLEISDTLPELNEKKPDVTIDLNHLAKFKALCGYEQDSGIPATYLQTLSMPLVLHIMSNPQLSYSCTGQDASA